MDHYSVFVLYLFGCMAVGLILYISACWYLDRKLEEREDMEQNSGFPIDKMNKPEK